MKSILEQEDMQKFKAVVKDVVKNELKKVQINNDDDAVFDVSMLAKYLCVETSWVYKQVSLGTLPYFKAGKYIRFKKSEIDNWIDSQTVRPVSALKFTKN